MFAAAATARNDGAITEKAEEVRVVYWWFVGSPATARSRLKRLLDSVIEMARIARRASRAATAVGKFDVPGQSVSESSDGPDRRGPFVRE